LHECVRGNHSDVPTTVVDFSLLDRQFPKALRERHPERVFLMAGRVQYSVGGVLTTIPNNDVWRVPDDNVVALIQNLIDRLGFLDGVDRRNLEEIALPMESFPLPAVSGLAAEQKTVARSQMSLPAWCMAPLQVLDAARLDRRHDQAESGDGHGERVDVHAPDAIERLLGGDDFVVLPLHPQAEEPGEGTEQEVPRAACRVDQPHLLQAELVDGRVEGPVENELLDEDRRLQQGVLLLRLLRKFLVQI